MDSSDRESVQAPATAAGIRTVAVGGVISWGLYLGVLWFSSRFRGEVPGTDRPIVPVLLILGVLSGLYLAVARLVVRGGLRGRGLPLIVVFSLAFRVLMLFSTPIQEIDAYRYLWDGKVAVAGVNPFRYSPQQVLDADPRTSSSPDLRRLAALRDRSVPNAVILKRVHYGELTTIYPPVSQLVFAAVAAITPHEASVATQLLILKLGIVLFDIATLGLVVVLLQHVGRPAEWCVIYGWCPLVIKEFANSGHLDSIAVCLTTAACVCAVKAFFPRELSQNDLCQLQLHRRECSGKQACWLWACSLCVALAVGAKIYPIILCPLLVLACWRVFCVPRTVAVSLVTGLLSLAMILPLLERADTTDGETASADRDDSKTGLSAFAAHWQMNDFLFLLISENLKPDRVISSVSAVSTGADGSEEPRPGPWLEVPPAAAEVRHVWFVLTPSAWRQAFVERVAAWTDVAPVSVPFLTTRVLTMLMFLTGAVWLAAKAVSRQQAEYWLQAVFLTLAWFWLLLPTQNPWYWLWALPLLPFARSRVWWGMSVVVLLYYLRFWLGYHYADRVVPGSTLTGKPFFDFVVVWLEFAPLLLLLAVSCRRPVRDIVHISRQQ